MALVPSAQYPAQTDTDPAYPQGKARNAGSFQDGTGTPLEKTWINDVWGFLQSLLAVAGITPSGAPDQVGASDYLAGVQFVANAAANKAGERVMLATWADGGELEASGLTALAWISAWKKFIVISENGDSFTSPDGQLWTAAGGTTHNAIAGNPAGVAVSVGGGGVVLTSPDGITWTSRTSGTSNELRCVAWTGALFVAGGVTGTIITSPTGTTWTTRTSGTTEQLSAVAGNATIIVMVGTNGKIITSPTGTTWTARTSGTTEGLVSVAWSATLGLFVAVGSNGKILTSPNGTTWTTRTSGTAENLAAVTATDNYLIAAGSNGALLFSADGVTWQKIQHASDSGSFDASGLAWSGLACVASGYQPSHGRISHSLARLP